MKQKNIVVSTLLILAVACGGGSVPLTVSGGILGFTPPTLSKAVLLSVSSNPVSRLAESNIGAGAFTLNLPATPSASALGVIFKMPTGCTGVTLTPANAQGTWAAYVLENAGQPIGELQAGNSDKVVRWVYVSADTTLSGTLNCPAPKSVGIRPQISNGTVYNLNLKTGWNLVLTDADETSFNIAANNTPTTWKVVTPFDAQSAQGNDDGSSLSQVKGTLGMAGYGLGLQLEKPGAASAVVIGATPVATTSATGSFNVAIPATINPALLGVISSLNQAGCTGTVIANNPSVLIGKLNTVLYRGNNIVGKAFLGSYSTRVGWWYASSAVTISGVLGCGSGDEVFSTQYNLNLKAGWNLVQQLEDNVLQISTFNNLITIPTGQKWFVQLEDTGVGIAPGPFGGLDAGSSPTRMRGKLGGWTDTTAADLKLESNKGKSLGASTLSATGELDFSLPATLDNTLLEPLDLTQGCGASAVVTPATPTGAMAVLEPTRSGVPIGLIAVGGRGFLVSWVYAVSAVQVTGSENCPSGDGQDEIHEYNINFIQGWNLMIDQVVLKNNNEVVLHTSGTLPTGSQWYFEADKEPGIPDTGSTSSALSGSVGSAFAQNSLRLKVANQQIAQLTLGANGEVSTPLPSPVSSSLLSPLSLTRAVCTGTITVSPASKYGALQIEVWNQSTFRTPVEITHEDSDGALEKISWWYLETATTVNGTQTCSGQVNRTLKYNVALLAGWNLLIEREEEQPSGERVSTFKVATTVPDGTAWGTN